MWIADYSHVVDQGWATANTAQVEDFRRRHRTGLVTLLFPKHHRFNPAQANAPRRACRARRINTQLVR
jgi:hypothetical protein